MTKTQKIWLGLFLAMFIVPEILWSPVGNFVYIFFQNNNYSIPLRANFLTTANYYGFIWYGLVCLIQLCGITLTILYCIKNKKNLFRSNFMSFVFFFVAMVCLLPTIFTFYLVTFVKISFP